LPEPDGLGRPASAPFTCSIPFEETCRIISQGLEKYSVRLALSALSGFLLFACFPSLDWGVLVWIAPLPLLLAVTSETGLRRAFLLGYICGAIFLAGSCYWFVYVMRRYGDMGPVLAVGVLVLFLIVFSVFFGGYALAQAIVARRSKDWALAAAPFLWVAMEVARTYLITGFPWNLLGYAVKPVGLRQLASVTAVYGLSFLVASVNVLIAWWLLEPRRPKRIAALAGLIVLLALTNHFQWFLSPPRFSGGKHRTFMLQPNIPLDESKLDKWIPWQNPDKLNQLVKTSVETACAGATGSPEAGLPDCSGNPSVIASRPLVIWPENPAPFYFGRDPVFRKAMETMATHTGAYVITGTVMFDASGRQPRNSAVVLDPQGHVVLVYDKIHLVPFGEYVPWWAFPSLVGKITFEAGAFLPGTEYKIAETPAGGIGVFICYESIFPQLVRKLVANGAGILVNISDDGWFGNSAAGLQHLEMARMRAIENGRYLLRDTNDGVTAIIDPRGEIVARLPRYQLAVLPGVFSFIQSRTFYTNHGDVFAWFCVAIAASMLLTGIMTYKKKERM
jgi:apolipoprotein N-acyltransferase